MSHGAPHISEYPWENIEEVMGQAIMEVVETRLGSDGVDDFVLPPDSPLTQHDVVMMMNSVLPDASNQVLDRARQLKLEQDYQRRHTTRIQLAKSALKGFAMASAIVITPFVFGRLRRRT